MINFFFENTPEIKLPDSVETWIESIITHEGKKPGEITYILGDDEYILKINRDFLDHDYYTDTITFDYVKGKTISGDIFVSLPRISDNASIHRKSFESELLRVMGHSVLHLCGYRDKSEDEKREMREKEEFYLNRYHNPNFKKD